MRISGRRLSTLATQLGFACGAELRLLAIRVREGITEMVRDPRKSVRTAP
jgi:hypothetical protein